MHCVVKNRFVIDLEMCLVWRPQEVDVLTLFWSKLQSLWSTKDPKATAVLLRCVSGSVPAACVCVTQWGEAGAEASTQQGKNDSHYPRCDRSHKSGSAFLTAAPSAKEVILDLEKTKVTLQSPRWCKIFFSTFHFLGIIEKKQHYFLWFHKYDELYNQNHRTPLNLDLALITVNGANNNFKWKYWTCSGHFENEKIKTFRSQPGN